MTWVIAVPAVLAIVFFILWLRSKNLMKKSIADQYKDFISEPWYKSLWKGFKKYTLYVLLLLSLIIIILYFSFKYTDSEVYNNNIELFKEIYGLRLAIFSSGVFLATLKWFQFMGFFKEELQGIISSSEFEKKLQKSVADVLYSDEFLSKQKDIENLWKRVNKALFQNEFSKEIAENIELKMQHLFFRNEKLSHHYRNMILTIEVSLDGDYVIYREISETKVLRTSDDKFRFDFWFKVSKYDKDDKTATVDIDRIKIDNVEVDLKEVEEINTDDFYTKKLWIDLQGKTEYHIFTDTTLKWNVVKDCEQVFYSQRFIDTLRVDLQHADNIKVILSSLGIEEFQEIPTKGKGFVKVFNGLLLPEKGFKLIFVPK